MKTKFKILLVITILLIASCIFNIKTVNATEVTPEESGSAITDPQEILDLIPDTIYLDILESEASNWETNFGCTNEDLLDEQIDTIMDNNNVNLYSLDFSLINDLQRRTIDGEDMRKCKITIYKLDENYNRVILAEKEITIQYKNSNQYDSKEGQYVQNKLKNLENLYEEYGENGPSKFDAKKYAEEIINDDSLTVKVHTSSSGAMDRTVDETEYYIYVFKDNVYYGGKKVNRVTAKLILVPDEIEDSDEAFLAYAKSENSGIAKEDREQLFELRTNGTYYDDYGFFCGYGGGMDSTQKRWVLRKAKYVDIVENVLVKEQTGLKVTATNIEKSNSTYTELLNKAQENGYGNAFGAYELKLISGTIGKDGLNVQFNLGTSNNGKKAIVIHKKSNGTYEQFIQTVKDGKVTVTVNELSPFMVVLEGKANNTNTNTNNSSSDRVLDDEPKTGVTDYTVGFASVVTFISIAGLAVLKFKK